MLTDTQCRTAKPKEKLYRLNDFNGLYLEVKPNGKKAWRYRFKLNGKSSMFALGEYPTVKLAEAREKCEQARKQVADGVSPTQARQLDKIRKVNDASNTFELIAKEWLQMKDWAEITKTRRLDMLERVVFPAIGNLEWQRNYIFKINEFLNKVKHINNLSFLQLILATHSPLLATDIPKKFICPMDKADATSGFASPIHLLLNESFGTKTIGEFASQRINKTVKNIKENNISEKDLLVIKSIDNDILEREIMKLIPLSGDIK